MAEYQPSGGSEREQKKGRSRAGCLLLVLALALPLLVIAGPLFSLFKSKPLKISKETTYITGPLTADGERIDYFAMIETQVDPKNMATEENGFRLLLQRIDVSSLSEPWHMRQICRKLGLEANDVQPDLTYEEPYEFLAAYVAGEDFDRAAVASLLASATSSDPPTATDTNRDASAEDESVAQEGAIKEDTDQESVVEDDLNEPADMQNPLEVLDSHIQMPWTLDELPMMELWLEENGPALDLLSTAVQQPIFHIPLARRNDNELLISLLLPHLQSMRSYARGLIARAQYRIGVGDIDGAIDDIVATKRLGRHLGHGATLIHLLVGIAVEAIADGVGIAGSPAHPPTKDQLQRLMRELADLPPMATLDDRMLFERYSGLDLLQRMAAGGESLDELDELVGVPSAARYFSLFGFDWNIAAQRLNEQYDLLIDRGIESPFPSFSGRVLISRRARSEFLADVLGGQLLPALNAVKEAVHRHQCGEQMKQVAMAMLVYECDHATLPPAYLVDGNNHPLHSWRVLLLPYLGQEELYRQVRLDESWDSKQNQELHDADIVTYRCPSVGNAKPGDTTYSVVVGADLPFEAGEGKKLADFGPNASNMILLVEREIPVSWMEPTAEVPQSDAEEGINAGSQSYGRTKPPANGIASPHPGGAMFACRDGSVRFFSEVMELAEFVKILHGTGTVEY